MPYADHEARVQIAIDDPCHLVTDRADEEVALGTIMDELHVGTNLPS